MVFTEEYGGNSILSIAELNAVKGEVGSLIVGIGRLVIVSRAGCAEERKLGFQNHLAVTNFNSQISESVTVPFLRLSIEEGCTGARVNSKIVPLNTTLEVGDVVEIITSPNSKGPSRDWLKFIKSSSAKAKIRQFYKNELKEENIKLGQAKMEEEAKKRGYALSSILTEESFKRISERFSFNTMDEMFAAVGYGSISVNQILFKLIDFYRKEKPLALDIRAGESGNKTPGGVLVNGQAGMLVRFAGCCSPVPGDEIVGYTSRGRGVVIHRADCPNVKGIDGQRLLPASWRIEAGTKQRYNANISIRATDQGAALSVLSFVVSDLKLSITAVNGRIDKNGDAVLEASVSLTDISEVDLLIKKMQADKRIYEVHRITSLS